MRVAGRIEDPKVKVIRTNNREGVQQEQKVIVGKVTLEYSGETVLYISENVGAPMEIELNPSQREMSLSAARGRPRQQSLAVDGGNGHDDSEETFATATAPKARRARRARVAAVPATEA